jgi:hypothetical protein
VAFPTEQIIWEILECPTCGEKFEARVCSNRMYCSRDCIPIPTPPRWWEMENAEDTKKKIVASLTGYKHTSEARKNMSRANMGNKSTLGKYGPESNAWKGGKTKEYRRLRNRRDWKEWREAVYQRDNYTCQKCQNGGVHLHPHHILNQCQFTDKVFDLDNGITLCKDCHYDFHKKYGFTSNDEIQIKEFIRGVD